MSAVDAELLAAAEMVENDFRSFNHSQTNNTEIKTSQTIKTAIMVMVNVMSLLSKITLICWMNKLLMRLH